MAAAPARLRCRLSDDVAEFHLLVPHPMETGMRLDERGEPIPLHHITELDVTLGARTVFSARMSFAVARDPLITFRVRGVRAGEPLRVAWTDNRGESRTQDFTVG